MNFALFLLLNAILLIRPEELLPDLAGLRLYFIVIGLCLLTTGAGVFRQLTADSLIRNPITACVLGFLVALGLSVAFRGMMDRVVELGSEFAKVVLYYLLLVAVIDSPRRFRAFLGAIVGFVLVLTALGLFQYHEYIDVEALRPLERSEVDPVTGELITFPQLRASGIYNDPNDLCLIVTTGTLCCLARSATAAGLAGRVAWLLPVGLFGYAIVLTKSRGGLLGLLAALFVLFCLKLGARRGVLLGVICLPVLLLAAGGRQANFGGGDDEGNTAQQRLRLWADGLNAFWRNPLTGIGADEFAGEFGLVAHNSFVQAYVETGLLGGTLFLSAFLFAAVGVVRLSRRPEFANRPPAFQALRPFVAAIVVGYAAGMYSVSRNYVVPTYMVLGLAAAYLRLSLPTTPVAYRLTSARVGQMALVGTGGLVFLKLFAQSLVRYGS